MAIMSAVFEADETWTIGLKRLGLLKVQLPQFPDGSQVNFPVKTKNYGEVYEMLWDRMKGDNTCISSSLSTRLSILSLWPSNHRYWISEGRFTPNFKTTDFSMFNCFYPPCQLFWHRLLEVNSILASSPEVFYFNECDVFDV
jgi:hypothetical protein